MKRTLGLGWAIAVALLLVIACRDKVPVAVLAHASEGMLRSVSDTAWAKADVGAKFFVGDAVQTAEGEARLALTGHATLRMKPRTLVRFGGKSGKRSVDLALGEATLEASDRYALDLGDGKGTLSVGGNSGIKLRATDGDTSVELLVGTASIDDGTGNVTDLTTGGVIQLAGVGRAVIERVDARATDAAPADAAVDAAVDALPAATATVVVVGSGAVRKGPGDPKPVKLAAGTTEQVEGTTVSYRGRSSGSASHQGVTVKAPAGSDAIIELGGAPFLALAQGRRVEASAGSGGGGVALPQGAMAFRPGRASAAIVDQRGNNAKISVSQGQVELSAKRGAKATLQRGETAVMLADGTIDVIEDIPDYFDMRVGLGESFTIVDPRPPTAVRFGFGDRCPSGGVLEVGRGGAFSSPRISGGTDGANMMLPTGSYRYRVRCDDADAIVATGSVAIRAGTGTKALPKSGPKYQVFANGTNWRVTYQNLLPVIELFWRGAKGGPFSVTISGGSRPASVLRSPGPSVVVNNLEEGLYSFYFENAATSMRSQPTSMRIEFNNVAPQAYIESPAVGAPWKGMLNVKGAVLGDASVFVEGVKLRLDNKRRFSTSIQPPDGRALAIKIAEQKELTYYLRRRP